MFSLKNIKTILWCFVSFVAGLLIGAAVVFALIRHGITSGFINAAFSGISAVGTAVAAFAACFAIVEHYQGKHRHLNSLIANAQCLSLRYGPACRQTISGGKVQYKEIAITLSNNSSVPARNIKVIYNGNIIGEALQNNRDAKDWGFKADIKALGGEPGDEVAVSKYYNNVLRDAMILEFTLDDYRFRKVNNRVDVLERV